MNLRKKILDQYDGLTAAKQKKLLAAWLWVLSRILRRERKKDLQPQPIPQRVDLSPGNADWTN
jgi:hypothetical protein